jgi:hypothetical protein
MSKIAKGEPSVISILISNGYATEHYHKWKKHPDGRVRSELARQGYWPDFFIQDKKPDVRALVEKYNALKLPVSPIEATMTWEQLYAINNPRWMNSLSAYDIIDVKNQ